jgi:IS1 family transposase
MGEHKNPDKPLESPEPLNIGKVYTDGNYACYERFSPEVLIVTRKNTRKIERKHLSLRTRCTRLAREGNRFPKTEQTRGIVVALVIIQPLPAKAGRALAGRALVK